MKKIFALFILVSTISFAQSDKEIAEKKGNEAVQLMDDGKIEESIVLLQESQKLDPENFNYPYEIAYANYQLGNYKKSIEILEQLVNYKGDGPELYTLWGNSYDLIDDPKKAVEIYDLGLKKFPNAGSIYLEKGVVFENDKKFDLAIGSYKKGISVHPNYPSNYYRIANLYLNSENKVPGLIYGEIFLNLERTSNRSKQMSENLFNAYESSLVFENNSLKELNLCKEVIIDVAKLKGKQEFPLCMVFGKNFILGVISAKEFNLDTLAKARKEFITSYFKNDNIDYPNVLFDYQKKMMENNVFDAYNHYIFQMGAPEEFATWLKSNEADYNNFVDWYTKKENILKPTTENYFEFNY